MVTWRVQKKSLCRTFLTLKMKTGKSATKSLTNGEVDQMQMEMDPSLRI